MGVRILADSTADLRLAARLFRAEPGFTAAAVITLAVGIGATTAVFAAVNAALLGQLPFPRPDRLVVGFKTIDGRVAGSVSRIDYFDYRDRSRSFASLAATANFTTPGTLAGGDEPRLVELGFVTWDYFRTLGVKPVLGRDFVAAEEDPGGQDIVIISHGLWQSRFGGATDVLDKPLVLNGVPLTIVGVMPQGARLFFDADVWAKVDRTGPFDSGRDSHSHRLVGRLRDGVSLEQAQAEMDLIAAALRDEYPEDATKGLWIGRLDAFLVRDLRTMLWLLSTVTALVLLVASANVAGLLLARGQRRLPEMAMRAALGASRGRLARQLLTETLTLALPAGALGVLVAWFTSGLLGRLLPLDQPGVAGPIVDGRVLGFALLVSLATGLAAGIVPALRGAVANPARQLGTGRQVFEGRRGLLLRSGLLVLQVAVSVVLVMGAGLVGRSLIRLAAVDLGFDPEGVFAARVQILFVDHPAKEARAAFFSSFIDEVEALPGVTSAALVNRLPILDPSQDWGVWRADQPVPAFEDSYSPFARWVSPGYFETLRIPLLRGRDIAWTDTASSPRVVVISEGVARRLYPERDPIGQTLVVSMGDGVPMEIVGIVGDARLTGVRIAGDAAVYMAAGQMGATQLRLAVRAAGDPAALAGPIREIVRRMDRNALLTAEVPLSVAIADTLSTFRVVVASLGLLSAVALALAAIGLYGVLTCHVTQRWHEIGVRLALGASGTRLVRLVLGHGLALTGAGLVAGIAASLFTGRLLAQFVYETAPLDLEALAGAVLLLAGAAALAGLLPAWRITRVRAMEVLRAE